MVKRGRIIFLLCFYFFVTCFSRIGVLFRSSWWARRDVRSLSDRSFEPWTNRSLSGHMSFDVFLVEFCRSTRFLGNFFSSELRALVFVFMGFVWKCCGS